MIRRNIRLRKEYLYKRSLSEKDDERNEKRSTIQQSLSKNLQIPGQLKNDAAKVLHNMEYEGDVKKLKTSDTDHADSDEKQLKHFKKIIPTELSIDCEYSKSGIVNPSILITTCRDPSSKLLQFAKELKLIFPNSVRINRGNHQLNELINACREHEASDLIIVHQTHGQPDGLVISHMPYGPTAYFTLVNVIQRHDVDDIEHMSLQYPHLIFDNFKTKLGDRVTMILKYLFPPTKDSSTRVITFSNNNDFISFRHHTWKKRNNQIILHEEGPRFELYLYMIKLGTLEMKDADTEWVLKPYTNYAKKNNL